MYNARFYDIRSIYKFRRVQSSFEIARKQRGRFERVAIPARVRHWNFLNRSSQNRRVRFKFRGYSSIVSSARINVPWISWDSKFPPRRSLSAVFRRCKLARHRPGKIAGSWKIENYPRRGRMMFRAKNGILFAWFETINDARQWRRDCSP